MPDGIEVYRLPICEYKCMCILFQANRMFLNIWQMFHLNFSSLITDIEYMTCDRQKRRLNIYANSVYMNSKGSSQNAQMHKSAYI